MPLPSGANGSTLLPSACVTVAETSVQLPTSCFAEAVAFCCAHPCDVPDSIKPPATATPPNSLAPSRTDLFMDFPPSPRSSPACLPPPDSAGASGLLAHGTRKERGKQSGGPRAPSRGLLQSTLPSRPPRG